MNLKSQKGTAQMWWILAGAIIAFVIVIFVLLWFKGSGGKLFDVLGERIDTFDDCDSDGVANVLDKCPCLPGEPGAEYDGCSTGITKEKLKSQFKVSDSNCRCKE